MSRLQQLQLLLMEKGGKTGGSTLYKDTWKIREKDERKDL